MAQTKRGTLVLQVGGWEAGWRPTPVKMFVTKTQRMSLWSVKRKRAWRCLRIGTWNVLSLYRPGAVRDAERLGVRNWRIKTKVRDGWRRLLESASRVVAPGSEWVNVCLTILDAFAKLRIAAISFFMYVRPTVSMEQLCSHWTDFNGTWYWRIVRKSVEKNSSFFKIGQESRVFYMKTNIHFLSYFAHFFLEWEMF